MKKYLMNTSIVPNDGLYEMKTISEEEARTWVRKSEIPVSAVGHPGTAEVMGILLGVEVTANRMYVIFEVGDEALVYKLNERLPEGKVLTVDELKELHYRWKILRRVK